MTQTMPAFKAALIAPCGMNCRLCLAYTRDKNRCPGCRGDDSVKMVSTTRCRIKNCKRIAEGGSKYCFDCDTYPCTRLRQLDKRYRTKYGMSMLENLEAIKTVGIRRFIASEKAKWKCSGCGATLCVHRPACLSCGRSRY